MKAVVINKSDSDKFPLLNKEKDSHWMYLDNLVSGDLWLSLDSETDIKKSGISYAIKDVEIIKVNDLT
tara:strand:+ start:938 stop:1141 length:204 start_codon:yes stop_codon:yes gene_type:complete